MQLLTQVEDDKSYTCWSVSWNRSYTGGLKRQNSPENLMCAVSTSQKVSWCIIDHMGWIHLKIIIYMQKELLTNLFFKKTKQCTTMKKM